MNEDLEMLVERTAKQFPYPPTPDLTTPHYTQKRRRAPEARRLAMVFAALIIVLAGLLAVPEIRAQVAALFRIGAVEIIMTTATPPARFAAGDTLPNSVLEFPGETSLEDAQAHAGYAVDLPTVLGAPDRVYLIQANRPITVLAWLDENGTVTDSLHLLPPGTYSIKMTDANVTETEVHGEWAVWIADPHWYILRTGSRDEDVQTRWVTMHALVWEALDGRMTYRFETNRSLDEAQHIAESLATGNALFTSGVLEGNDR